MSVEHVCIHEALLTDYRDRAEARVKTMTAFISHCRPQIEADIWIEYSEFVLENSK